MASFSPVLEETIHRALTLASDRKHELATLEHLLLALLDDKDAAAVISACDVDIEPLRADVQRYLDEDLASLMVENFEEARPTAGGRSHGRECASCAFCRTRISRGLFPARTRYDAL